MRRAEGVVDALRALGETGQTAPLAQGAHARAPAGQDLVRIGLMADVPDQLVARRVEHVMQRDRELDHAQAGAQMAARDRHRIDGFLAQLGRELFEIVTVKRTEIGRIGDPIQQRGLGRRVHRKSRLWGACPYALRATANKAAARKRSAFSSNKSR